MHRGRLAGRRTFYADALAAHLQRPGYPVAMRQFHMSRGATIRATRALLLLAVLAAVAACTPGSGAVGGNPGWSKASPDASGSVPPASASVVPVIINSQSVVGPNRFLFSFLDAKTNLPAASPDRTAHVAFIPPGASQPGAASQATFLWAIEGSRGEYVLPVTFDKPGDWKAVFVTQAPGGKQEAIGVAFQVVEDGSAVAVGEKAPATDNPTASDVNGDLKQISTDPNPDPKFYELSVKDALAQGKPFILVFATPAFCQSAQCGPTLETVKAAAKDAPANVAFINVEPYKMTRTASGGLQPVLDANNQLQTVDAVDKWGILTEPWIYAVDRTGVVRASFEGVASKEELAAAIKDIASR